MGGLSTLGELTNGLIDAGLSDETPAVAVQDGTTLTQRVVASSLGSLTGQVEKAGLRSPTLVVIGNVVSLMSQGSTQADDAVQTIQLTAEEAQSLVQRVCAEKGVQEASSLADGAQRLAL